MEELKNRIRDAFRDRGISDLSVATLPDILADLDTIVEEAYEEGWTAAMSERITRKAAALDSDF